MKYSHILWDFNGTILNDVDIGLKSANILLKRHGIKELNNVEEYRKIFCFPIINYYEKLGFDFNQTPYNQLAVEWVEIYNSLEHKVKLYDGIINILTTIQKAGIKQFILSATEIQMLKNQTDKLGISKYFDDILGTGDIYAYSKKEIAINWANRENPNKALLIGDTSHDKDVADAAGFDCILIANGHEDELRLKKTNAIIVNSTDQIFDLI